MKISFHGAAQQVTGSKHLIQLRTGKKILLDCGLFQGEGEDTDAMNRHFGFNPRDLDAVILSHAHIDHSGLLPRLCAEGYDGPIYCTPATKELVKVMLMDSAEIQEEDYEHERRHQENVAEPLYNVRDVRNCAHQFKGLSYNATQEILPGVELKFTDAGHILGSAIVSLSITEGGKTTRIAFTGDLGRYGSHILRDPAPFPQADILIAESTYGDRLHLSKHQGEEVLRKAVLNTCGRKKGKLLIPSFSLGRTQELIYILNKLRLDNKIPSVPVFVDSPLSEEVTNVVSNHPECFDDETSALMERDPEPFDFPELHFTQNVQESIALNKVHKPCIIIASSGMLEAGRIRHHLIHNLEDARNTVLLMSYTPPGSLGDRLKKGADRVRIWGNHYDVKAEILYMDGFSAHGDRDEMLRTLSCQDKSQIREIFLVHGEYDIQRAWRETLLEEGYKSVYIPERGESVKLQ